MIDRIARTIAMDACVSPDNAYTKAQTDVLLAAKVDKESGKGLSTEDYTTAEKEKLAGIGSGAEANVQSDWNQNDDTADDYIKNKPGITDTATQSSADLITSGGVYTIVGNINAVLEEVL